MITIKYQIRVPAPIDKTFAAYSDPYALAKILPEITSVHRKSGGGGLKARDVFELNLRLSGRDWKQELELLEYIPATEFKTRSSDHWAENICAMKFEKSGSTTLALCEVEYRITKAWLKAFEPLFTGILAREALKRARVVNEHLKPGQESSVKVLKSNVWGAPASVVKWGICLGVAAVIALLFY